MDYMSKKISDGCKTSCPSDLNDNFYKILKGYTNRICIALYDNQGENKNTYQKAIDKLKKYMQGNLKLNIMFETAQDMNGLLDIIHSYCTEPYNEITIFKYGEKKITKGYKSFFGYRNKDTIEVKIFDKFYSLDNIYQSIVDILDVNDARFNFRGQNKVNFILDTFQINENISIDAKMSKLGDIFTNNLVMVEAKDYGVLMSPIDIDCFGPGEIPQLTSTLLKRIKSDIVNNTKRSISLMGEVIGVDIMEEFINKSQGRSTEERTHFWEELKTRLQVNPATSNERIKSILCHNYVTYNGSTKSSKFIFVNGEDFFQDF